MKILYAIQGTGNGHISRARDVIPELMKKGEVDILISGTEAEVDLPYPVKFRLQGLSFVFGKKGGIDLLATYRKGNLKRLYAEIQHLPVEEYDMVLSDFEPVSSWACRLRNKTCIGLSHQAAVINKRSPRPLKTDVVGRSVLKYYAPVTTSYGFHFESYDSNIYTPVIRKEIRDVVLQKLTHYTVYLPAYSDSRIMNVLAQIPDVQWQIFSKNARDYYKKDNMEVYPINNGAFIKSMVTSTGVLCGAGFETPAEAIYLNKKLLVIPMKGQYEQQCNAAALHEIGIPVIKSLKEKHIKKINAWVQSHKLIGIQYPDLTCKIIEEIISTYMLSPIDTFEVEHKNPSFKKFTKMNFGMILKQLSR